MHGFSMTAGGKTIHFVYYLSEAPRTVAAFASALPFKQHFIHARYSGHEIWTDKAPLVDVIQEHASVFTQPGEVVIGPVSPKRNKTAGCMGIYYGEGKGLDACNIFAKVADDDLELLIGAGNDILLHGQQLLEFNDWPG